MRRHRVFEQELILKLEPKIPRHLPIEQLRQWLLDKVKLLDEERKAIKKTIESRRAYKRPVRYLCDKSDRNFEEREYYMSQVGKVNREIKERNQKMHSLKKGDTQRFIELAKLLEELYPDIYDDLMEQVDINLNIRQKRTNSAYVSMMNAR